VYLLLVRIESSWSNESPQIPNHGSLEGRKKHYLAGTVDKQLTAVITLASRNEIHKFLTSNWLFAGVTREGVCTKRSICYHLAGGGPISKYTQQTYMSVGLAVSHFLLMWDDCLSQFWI